MDPNVLQPVYELFHPWFKHILLARTVDIIKQMLTVLKLQGLEWKQHAYIIPFLITSNILHPCLNHAHHLKTVIFYILVLP